tara:strand:+ start:113 stop:268 length:156 start_codon:yes stop_codon:yes gene_type:complete
LDGGFWLLVPSSPSEFGYLVTWAGICLGESRLVTPAYGFDSAVEACLKTLR